MPAAPAADPARNSVTPRIAAKAAGSSSRRSFIAALEGRLHGRCGHGRSVREADAAPQGERDGLSVGQELPPLAEKRHEVSLRIGGDERLEDGRQDLLLLDGPRRRRIGRRHRVRQRHDERAALGRFLRLPLLRRQSLDLREVRRRFLVLAAHARHGRGEREEADERIRRRPCARAASRPRSAQRRASSTRRACQAASAAKSRAATARPGLFLRLSKPSRRPRPRAGPRRGVRPSARRARGGAAPLPPGLPRRPNRLPRRNRGRFARPVRPPPG